MSIRVTFDNDESTQAFAAKHGLPTPTGNTLETNFHLLEQVSKDVGDSARILKIDIDTNRNVATQYGIRSVPTLILFKEGKQVWRQSGVPPKNLIVESVNNFV